MTAIQTKQIFPVYHSADRSEFRLEDDVYLSSFRLANIQPKPSGPITYQSLVGVGALFKTITLYSGDVEIEQARNVHEWLGFQQLRTPNPVALDLQHQLNGTRWGGWKLGARGATSGVETVNYGDNEPNVKPDVNAEITAGGTLNLSSVFGFLKQDDILPPIPNLRIVVEWRINEAANVFAGISAAINYTMQEPVLFLDSVKSPELLKKVAEKSSYSLPYFVNEFDVLRVSSGGAIAADAVAPEESLTVNAFRGKSVRRLMMVNVPETVGNIAADVLKKDASIAMRAEKINLRINGRNYFALNAIDSQSKKLSVLASAWGSMNVPAGCQFFELDDFANSYMEGSNIEHLRGKLSYFGCFLGQRISEMEVVYQRTGYGATAAILQRAPFNLHVWGEVAKSLRVSGGNVVVSYS